MPRKKNSREKKEERHESPTRKYDKQVIWIFSVMIGLVILFLLATSFFKEFNNFKYEGIKFEKIKYGNLDLYHSRYPLQMDSNGTIEYYNLFLREDPRKNEVHADINTEFPQGKYVYISVNATGLIECENSGIAIAGLSQFLTLNKLMVRGAVPDKAEAENASVEYAICGYPEERVVILIQRGEETKIEQDGMCYKISVGKCEDVIKATEKFELKALIDARARAGV